MENKSKKITPEKNIAVKPRKKNFYFGVLITGLLLIAVSFVFKTKDVETELFVDKDAKAEENDNANVPGADYFEGVLGVSDNNAKGNLKLDSKEGSIYLRTSRDFSALIGAEVLVLIEGTLENFRMIDIQGKLEDGGYLKSI